MSKALDTLDRAKAFIKNYKGIPSNKKLADDEFQAMSIIYDGNVRKPTVNFGIIDEMVSGGFDTEHAKIQSVEIDDERKNINYYHWMASRTNKDKNWNIELVQIGVADRAKKQISVVWRVGDDQPEFPIDI